MADPLRCPRCHLDLATVRSPGWRTFRCENCEGVAVTLAVLRRIVPPERLRDLWMLLPSGAAGDPCPACLKALTGTRVATRDDVIDLDACRRCQLIWFDANELRRFAPARKEPAVPSRAGANTDRSSRVRRAHIRGAEPNDLGEQAIEQAVWALAIITFLVRMLPSLRFFFR